MYISLAFSKDEPEIPVPSFGHIKDERNREIPIVFVRMNKSFQYSVFDCIKKDDINDKRMGMKPRELAKNLRNIVPFVKCSLLSDKIYLLS
jgi:hypothetical protein